MGLKLAVNSPFGRVENDAHIVLKEMLLDFVEKKGRLEIAVWENKQAKVDGKRWIALIAIPIGHKTVIIDNEFDINNGCITMIGFDELKDKTIIEIYTKLKKLKLIFNQGNIDLKQAVED